MFENEKLSTALTATPQTYQLNPLLPNAPPPATEATIAHYQAELDEAFSADPPPTFALLFITLGEYSWLLGRSDSPLGAGGQCGAEFYLIKPGTVRGGNES